MAKEFEVVSHTHLKHINAFLVRVEERVTHVHRDLEIGYLVEGSLSLRMGQEITPLQKGDLFVINRMEAHEFLSDGNGALIAAMQLSPELTEGFLTSGKHYRLNGSPNIRIQMENQPEQYQMLCANCIELTYAFLKRREQYEFECFSLAASLIYQIHKYLPVQALAKEDYYNIKQRANRIMKITDYIDQNFTRKLLLAEIAENENLSLTYLSHFFKDNIGMSFQEYLNRKRFEYACQLLFTTDQKVLDISINSGFSDVRYFNEHFQAQYGCTPREYRKGARTKKTTLAETASNTQYFFKDEDARMMILPLLMKMRKYGEKHTLKQLYED